MFYILCRSREPGINWPLQFVPEKLGRFENNAEIIQFFKTGYFFSMDWLLEYMLRFIVASSAYIKLEFFILGSF